MSYGYQSPPNNAYNSANPSQNLNFYQSSYPTSQQPVSGQTTPFQAAYGNSAQPSQGYGQPYAAGGAASSAGNYGFGAFSGQGIPGASGQMGTGQGGLRTGWLAAFGTEGYDGEPPLLQELGVNFRHIQMKVCLR